MGGGGDARCVRVQGCESETVASATLGRPQDVCKEARSLVEGMEVNEEEEEG